MSRGPRLRFIEPQLPSLTDQPPEGADWIHEVSMTAIDPDGGSAATLAANECPVLAKAARAKELENLLQ